MDLLELPLELVYAILSEVVSVIGIQEAVGARLVCKLFDAEIQRAIFDLPMFEATRKQDPALPFEMSPELTARLIQTKLKRKDAGRRPLCKVITGAICYLEDVLEDYSCKRQRCIEDLALAAARKLPLSDIVECLSSNPEAIIKEYQKPGQISYQLPRPSVLCYLTPGSDQYLTDDLNNALVAAIVVNDIAAMSALQQMGAESSKETHAFGHPVEVAAANGFEDTTRTILEQNLPEGDEAAPAIIRRPTLRSLVLKALMAAARAGHENIITMIMDDPKLSVPKNIVGFQGPTRIALEEGHEKLALRLLHYRNPVPLNLKSPEPVPVRLRREARIWYRFISTGLRYDRQIFLQNAMNHFPNFPDVWLPLLTHTIRHNALHVVEVLMINPPLHIKIAEASEESRKALKNSLESAKPEMMNRLSTSGLFHEGYTFLEGILDVEGCPKQQVLGAH